MSGHTPWKEIRHKRDLRAGDVGLVGGVERREIVIARYDPSWPARFDAERARIVAALGPAVVHHVGSTSVVGLAAKPVIDVIVVVDPPEEAVFLGPLEGAGYELRVREPDHWMLRTIARDVHVHVWADPADVDRHLLFRDWLRAHASDRAAYARLKRDLAQRDWDSMNDYADAKSAFVDEVVRRAAAEACAS